MAYAEKRGKGPTPWRARFKLPDGTWDSKPGFPTKAAALDYGREQEADVRRGEWRDPKRGQRTFKDWAEAWIEAQDLARTTMDRYRTRLRIHLMPRWGDTPLADIRPIEIKAWLLGLAKSGLKPATVDGVRGLLGTILEDAVLDGLLDTNPARRPRRRGKWTDPPAPEEKVWATEADVLRVARNARVLTGEWAYVLILVAAYTGMRWGELVGLKRQYVLFDAKAIRVEVQLSQRDDGTFEEEPPKYGSKRTLLLPRFLTLLLREYIKTLPDGQEHLFVRAPGVHPLRKWFSDCTFRPAVDGRKTSYYGTRLRKAGVPAVPGAAGLTPHGLRHGHDVWLDEAKVPRVAVEARLGHRSKGTYSHVSRPMEEEIVEGLQRRWEASLEAVPEERRDTAADAM